jgi:hypothetical protein
MPWTVETLNAVVDAELEALPDDMKARFARIVFLIEESAWSASVSRMSNT